MRKNITKIVVLTLLLALTGCLTQKPIIQDTMTIKPSEFSEETNQILKILDEEIIFFDFDIDEIVKSYMINDWTYKMGSGLTKG